MQINTFSFFFKLIELDILICKQEILLTKRDEKFGILNELLISHLEEKLEFPMVKLALMFYLKIFNL